MEKYTHPILQEILLDDGSALKRRKPNDSEIMICSEREGYIFQCSQGIVVLTTAVEKAKFSIELLRHSAMPVKGSIFSHSEQIQFAIENYYIRSATIYDRALIFIGHLLDLGIIDKQIDHTDMVTNRHVKRYQLTNELKNLGKVCRELNDERNAIIHHRSYQTETFNKYALLSSANEMSLAIGKKRFVPLKTLKALTAAVLSDHTDEFEVHLKSIQAKLDFLLDTALAVYKIRRETYNDETGKQIKEEDLAD